MELSLLRCDITTILSSQKLVIFADIQRLDSAKLSNAEQVSKLWCDEEGEPIRRS
jgi:hypothetical protein